MNTNPQTKRVLCFGDSNTWASRSNAEGEVRLAPDLRWTGKLQKELGECFTVIEEGMCARNIDVTQDKPERNGKNYLLPCVLSTNPVDVVIIMLGTNDFKMRFKRSATDAAASMADLIMLVKNYGKNLQSKAPCIIIVSPININIDAAKFAERFGKNYDQKSADSVKELAIMLQQLAHMRDCAFVNAADHAVAGEDGIHIDEPSHAKLACALAPVIKQACK